MYKCGWNGCEKAYGTLNHLNAHVTMQSHGSKRTPEGKSIHRKIALPKRVHTRDKASFLVAVILAYAMAQAWVCDRRLVKQKVPAR